MPLLPPSGRVPDLFRSPDAAGSALAATGPDADKRLRDACQGMESLFLNMLLTEMRKTVPRSKLLGGEHEEDIMRSMLDMELSQQMAKAGGIGLADMLYRQLKIEQKAKTQFSSQASAAKGQGKEKRSGPETEGKAPAANQP